MDFLFGALLGKLYSATVTDKKYDFRSMITMNHIKTQCTAKGCKTCSSNLYLLAQHIYDSHMGDIIDILNSFSYPERSQLLMYITGMMKRSIGEESDEVFLTDNSMSGDSSVFLLNDYINPYYPISREKRQYSLYLHNKIKEMDKDVLKAIGLTDCSIEGVFLEAAFMRDYWYTDKEEFNRTLKEYIEKKFDACIDGGSIGSAHPKNWQVDVPYPRWMMNAKPDIAVVVKKDNEYRLHFIECKYFHGEGKYSGMEADSNEIVGYKTENQENIIEFLCDHLCLKYRDSSGMENPIQRGKVIKVQFVSEQYNKKYENYAVVEIKFLLK